MDAPRPTNATLPNPITRCSAVRSTPINTSAVAEKNPRPDNKRPHAKHQLPRTPCPHNEVPTRDIPRRTTVDIDGRNTNPFGIHNQAWELKVTHGAKAHADSPSISGANQDLHSQPTRVRHKMRHCVAPSTRVSHRARHSCDQKENSAII